MKLSRTRTAATPVHSKCRIWIRPFMAAGLVLLPACASDRKDTPPPCRGDELVCLGADVGVTGATSGYVASWADQSGKHNDATAQSSTGGAVVATTVVNSKSRPVLRFDGSGFLTAPPHVPARGTIFVVLGSSAPTGDTRVIGWEDAFVGNHGIGISPSLGPGAPPSAPGALLVVARENGEIGDVLVEPRVS